MSAENHTKVRRSEGSGWQLFIIAAASAFSPLIVWANAGESPNLLDLLLMWAVFFSVGTLLRYLLVRLGLDPLGSTYATSGVILIVTNTGAVVSRFPLGRAGLLLFALLVALTAYRLRELGAFRIVMTWVTFVVLAFPVVTIVGRLGTAPEQLAYLEADLVVSGMTAKPDVVFVVVDAYGSAESLEEFYDFDNTPFLHKLSDLGFDAGDAVTANYARTQLSISSVLQMDYITGVGVVSDGDIRGLLRVIAGDNNIVHALKNEGYRHIYVESGWLGTVCGSEVDLCVEGRWPDETVYDVAYRTLLRGLPGFEVGRSFTEGAIDVVEWMDTGLATYLNDDQPDIIFIHLLLPHPPMFLSADCTPNWRSGLPGFAVAQPWSDQQQVALARGAYVQQVECVNTVLLRLASDLSADDAVVIMGDHGPDSQAQLFYPGSIWTEDQRSERYGVMFAARVPGCDMSSIGSLVNAGRRTLSCLSRDQFADLPTQLLDMSAPSRRTAISSPTTDTAISSWLRAPM